MIFDEHLRDEIIKHHSDMVERLEKQVLQVQSELVYAYKKLWSEINYFLSNDKDYQWPEYKANAYGVTVPEHKMVILQLDGMLPFMPKTSDRVYRDNNRSYMSCKAFIDLRLRDVAYKLEEHRFSEPAAMYIKHYTKNMDKPFDMDNRVRNIITNSIKGSLLANDSYVYLPYYSEETFINVLFEAERTLVFLVPKLFLKQDEVQDILKNTEDIKSWPGVVASSLPGKTLIDIKYLTIQESMSDEQNEIPDMEKNNRKQEPVIVNLPSNFI